MNLKFWGWDEPFLGYPTYDSEDLLKDLSYNVLKCNLSILSKFMILSTFIKN